MKIKKIGFNLALGTLTIGASAILGFLSFGGMYALLPILPLAVVTLILSVAYEGEIYLQNIRSSLKKLLKRKYIALSLSNEFLLNHFPDVTKEDCPRFFRDYARQLKVLSEFGHKKLDAASLARKQQVEKKLRKMEKWFSAQIFTRKDQRKIASPYRAELQRWLYKEEHQIEDLITKRKRRAIYFNIAKIFSVIAGLFMTLGSSYLLVSAFAAIPFIAALPFGGWAIVVVPLAIIAGAAYGMLIYNAVTNMIENDTVRKWFFKIRDDWREGHFAHSIFIATVAVALGALAIALTVCTAGTWWTIAKNARPIFDFMTKIPTFIMGIINPIIIGISSIIFNWQNTSETLDMIYDATKPDTPKPGKAAKEKPGFFARLKKTISKGFENLRKEENWLQIFNPFRIILKVVLAPLRIILFIGHIISMGVADDQMPGMPQWLAALLSTTSEIFEDAHYFIPESHHHHKKPSVKDMLQDRHGAGHSHSHDNDLPTRFLNLIFAPIYFLAAAWDAGASQLNTDKKKLNLGDAWKKHWGIKEPKTVEPDLLHPVSDHWLKEEKLYADERSKEARTSNATMRKTLVGNEPEPAAPPPSMPPTPPNSPNLTRHFKTEPAKLILSTSPGNPVNSDPFVHEHKTARKQ